MDPWAKGRVQPSLHAFDRIAQRGPAPTDLERMVREGERQGEGPNRFLVRHGAWEIPVQLRRGDVRQVSLGRVPFTAEGASDDLCRGRLG